MEPLRAAIIGCGRMGSTIDDELPRWASSTKPYAHAARYAAVPDTVLVAACDSDEEKLAACGEKWGLQALYADIETMMALEQPDIVSICTRTCMRHEVAMQVIAHKPRAIFLEKPMAETLRQCDEIIAACEAAGIITAVNCSRRWEPGYTQAKALVAEVIGPLRCVTGFCPGRLSHMGSHLLDLVRYLVDDAPAEWVTGHVPGAAEDDEDVSGLGMIQFSGPISGYVNMLDAGAVGVEVDLIGTTGRVHIGDNGNWCRLWVQTKEGLGRPSLAELPFPQPLDMPTMGRMSVIDIADCVRNGGKPRCSAIDGRAALELALALRHSERVGGQRVALPYPDVDEAIRSV